MVKSLMSAVFILVGILSGIPAAQSTPCEFPPKGLLEQPRTEFHALYVNEVYDYTVVIPEDLTGYSQAAPSPQHGFGVPLGSHDDAYIYVDGQRNSLAYHTALDGALDLLSDLSKSAKSVESATIMTTRLGGIEAVNVTVTYTCGGSSGHYTQWATIALSPDRDNLYTITLYSSADPPEHYRALLREILNSWKYRPSSSHTIYSLPSLAGRGKN